MLETTTNQPEPLLGILGGLGPLASSRFIASIYRSRAGQAEQTMPRVILYSDPSFPDRTEAFLEGNTRKLVMRTSHALDSLLKAGADRLVICCFTLHHIVRLLPTHIRERLISLPDLALKLIVQHRTPSLIFCTTGSRQLGVFEASELWPIAKEWARFPNEKAQSEIHRLIYKLKAHFDPSAALAALEQIGKTYDAPIWVYGCTEFHLLSNLRSEDPGSRKTIRSIDPLYGIVEELNSKLARTQT